jgi:GMP synthase-like glutamine amidotransferase
MIWYVDIENEKTLADPRQTAYFDGVRAERTQVCGQTSGMKAESIFYRDVSLDLVRRKGVKAIAISGSTTDWAEYDFKTFEPLFDVIRSGMPTIGLCGGHQLIGLMAGATCDAIRKLNPGEPDEGGFAPGWFKEVGFKPIQVIRDDPLFAGLGKTPVFLESHYCEIKDTPPELIVLASTADVRVQAFKHRDLPIYGTQFHPEASNSDHPDGFTLLKNFFHML